MSFAKAESVVETGEPDGWTPETAFRAEVDPEGGSRLLVTAAADELPHVHASMVRALTGPLGFLYRQRIDRRDPKPEGTPGRDFVALDLPADRVVEALVAHADLIYGDARCEVWVRGAAGEQLILDQDGVAYAYPDNEALRDALVAAGVPEKRVITMADRDYVKHWFRSECDAHEDALRNALNLTEVPHQR